MHQLRHEAWFSQRQQRVTGLVRKRGGQVAYCHSALVPAKEKKIWREREGGERERGKEKIWRERERERERGLSLIHI